MNPQEHRSDAGECNQVERLEKYGERLEQYGNRLTSLEMGQRHMNDVFDLAERRIMGVVEDLKEIVETGFAALDKRLFTGNGKPSLEQRIDKVERWMDREDGAEAQSARAWDYLQPFLPWIGLLAGAAAMYFIKSTAK